MTESYSVFFKAVFIFTSKNFLFANEESNLNSIVNFVKPATKFNPLTSS